MKRLIADCEFPPQVSASTLHQVEGVIAGDNRECFQVMRVSGDRVLLIFDDVGVRTRILASDSLSKWFDRVAEWNEEDCAMGCWRVCISIFGVPIHAWSRETVERVMSHWGNVILVV
ncbi:hypothetical protein V6N13_016813 [Hibiscus sabdariffa]